MPPGAQDQHRAPDTPGPAVRTAHQSPRAKQQLETRAGPPQANPVHRGPSTSNEQSLLMLCCRIWSLRRLWGHFSLSPALREVRKFSCLPLHLYLPLLKQFCNCYTIE